MTTRLSGSLRIVSSAAIALTVIAVGYLHRSPWTILLAAPAFTVLYVMGEWLAWKTTWRVLGLKTIIFSLLATLTIQAFLAAIFYLIGLGLSMLTAAPSPIAPLSSTDVRTACTVFAIGFALALVIIRLESGRAVAAATETEKDPVEDFTSQALGATDEMIHATEGRLGVKLPETLRR